MAFILRFVQRYRPADRARFMELEAQTAALERRRPDFPKGRRRQPLAGREQTCSLIWECEFPSLAAVQEALALLDADPEHARLFQEQAPYMAEAYTEVLETLDLA